MQQFARRQPQDGPNPEPTTPIANETMAQLLDQITTLQRQVAAIGEELGRVKADNTNLRSQIAGVIAGQVSEPTPVAADPVPAAPAPNPIAAPEARESVDEELLVEWVRGSGLGEAKSDDLRVLNEQAPSQNVEPTVEKTASAPLSDDEIQRLLAEAAGAAVPSATESAPEPAVVAEQPEPATFLRLEEAEQVFEGPIQVGFDVSSDAIAKVPSHLAIGALAIPFRIEGNKIFCKSVSPFDRVSLDMIATATACEVVAEEAPIEQVVTALRAAYKGDSYEDERDSVWDVAESPKKRRGLAKLFGRAA